MEVRALFKRLIEANERRYERAENPLRSHGPDHHVRVWEHALQLAKKESYHDFDHVLAAEVLAEVGFPEKKRELVEADFNYSLDFFRQLKEGLGNES